MVTYDIERYLNIRSAYGASFGPDGERLSFLMDTTGTSQVWTLEGPQEWPEQRTFSDERVTFATWSPERPELIFGMDEGGNERAQLFRLEAETGAIENLTAMPDAKHRWGGFSHDGEFAFASNRREESVFDVYVQGRDETEDARLVHEGDGWLSVSGGARTTPGCSSHRRTRTSTRTCTCSTSKRRNSTTSPPRGRRPLPERELGARRRGIYLVTDHGDADTLYLAYLDVETRDLETVTEGEGWNVDGIALDDETGRFVYSQNVEGYTELTVGEFDDADPTEFETFAQPDLRAASPAA